MTAKREPVPDCIYGKPCFAICINPQCRKQGVICQEGFENRDECGLFHEGCLKVLWSELERVIYNNPHLASTDFQYALEKMENLFVNTIQAIKHEHQKFKTWVKTYGHSIEVMKFVKNLSDKNYVQIQGNIMAEIIAEIFTNRKVESPTLIESEIALVQQELTQSLQRITDLYLKPGQRRFKPVSSQGQPKALTFNSRITQEITSITRHFQTKVASFKLLYRASESSFSIQDFHKKCDGIGNTLMLLETQFGKIIGGFTPIAWSSAKKQWAADKTMKSFIFSMNMREKFNLNLAQFAIANNPEKGPTFGCCDICVVDNANKERSNAQFPISYNNGKYIRSPEASFAFTGHPKGQFLVKQWEIFRVDFE